MRMAEEEEILNIQVGRLVKQQMHQSVKYER